jgi:hypothetical protein
VEAAGDAAGLAAVAAAACLRVRFALGDAAGEAASAGDAAVSAVDAAVSDFLCARRFVGSGDCPGEGDWSCATHTPANTITQSRVKIFVVIALR